MRWSLSGFEPTSVSRVAPDWDRLDGLFTELQRRGRLLELNNNLFSKAKWTLRSAVRAKSKQTMLRMGKKKLDNHKKYFFFR